MGVKKGQATIFMILGIFILLSTLVLVFMNFQRLGSSEVNTEVMNEVVNIQPITSFIEKCIGEVGYDALYYLGRGGGSIVIDGEELITSYSIIDFLYEKGVNKIHSKEEMGEQLSFYIDGLLDSCLNNFTDFQGYDFSFGDINTSTLIREEDVVFTVYYPINIESKESTTEISEFSVTLPVRLGHVREIAYSIVERQVQDPGWVDITYMSDFDVNVTIYPYNKTTLVYGIIDDKSLVYNEPYEFLFANKFKDE